MKSTQRFSSERDGGDDRLDLLVRQAPTLENTRDFGCFLSRNFPRFDDFALQFALIMLLIGARRQKSAEPHGDRAGGDFRQPRQHHDRGSHFGARQPGRQRKWNRQSVRHADDDVPDHVAGSEVVLGMRRCLMRWLPLFSCFG